jgi:hypothetical protein
MDDTELLDAIALGGIRSVCPPRAKPLQVEYVRELTFADIEVLRTIPSDRPLDPAVRLRSTHHALARLIAQGVKIPEAAAATGHTPARINFLIRNDRGFGELVAHYREAAKEHCVDVQARLALLGTSAAEALLERLDEAPEGFTNNELMKLAELTLDRSVAPPKGAAGRIGGSPTGPVSVSVTFVSPGGEPLAPPASPPMIEIAAEESPDHE